MNVVVLLRAIYNVLDIDREEHKELLGMYISKNEGVNFWLCVLTDLQNRGVEDILIACIDGLKGFSKAIQSVYPNTAVQLCVVHCRVQKSKGIPEGFEMRLSGCK